MFMKFSRWKSILRHVHKASVLEDPYSLNLSIKGYNLMNYVEKLTQEYSSTTNNGRRIELQPLINVLDQRKQIVLDILHLEDLLRDPDVEIQRQAVEEKQQYEKTLIECDKDVLNVLLPRDEDANNDVNCTSIMVEIKEGIGGQEAMLFAKELLDMYHKYAIFKGWQIETADYNGTDLGGIHYASIFLTGAQCFRRMRHEAGIHRVQRIPVTERGGRIHTSTAAVMILPQPHMDDAKYADITRDVEIQVKQASGPGGQSVNKSQSAVRLIHRPTGLATECQVERSQVQNKRIAFRKLTAMLYEREYQERDQKFSAIRQHQVRTNFRNEKIRTYNYFQDRVTDHRLQQSVNCEQFLSGRNLLDDFITCSENEHRVNLLLKQIGAV